MGRRVDARPGLVLGDPGETGVDDVADARDGERCLGHVRGDDDLRPGHGIDAALLLGRQARVERQDGRPGVVFSLEPFAGFEDVLLGGHEDEAVARLPPGLEALDGPDGHFDVVGLVHVPGKRFGRHVLQVHGKEAPADVDDGRLVEGLDELLGVERRRSDDHLELGAGRQERPGEPQEKIDVQAALVGFVDDQGVVFEEVVVGLRLGQEHAVGHDLDVGFPRRPVLEADLVAHRAAEGLAELFGDAIGDGHGGDPARLGAGDHPGHAAPGLEAHLGDLGALAAARLAGDDHHGMPADGLDDLLGLGGDGQGPRHADVGPVAAAGVVLGGRLPEALLDRRQLFDEGLGLGGIGRKYTFPIAFVAFWAADGTEPVAEFAEPSGGEGPVAKHRLRDERPDPVHELRRADASVFRRRRGRRGLIFHDYCSSFSLMASTAAWASAWMPSVATSDSANARASSDGNSWRAPRMRIFSSGRAVRSNAVFRERTAVRGDWNLSNPTIRT